MVFVTGGSGLLGAHLLIELSKRGIAVRALKRTDSDLTEVQSLFKFYLNDQDLSLFNKIEWVNGNLNDVTSLRENMAGCDGVYHCAGLVSFRKKDFKKLVKINKEGTQNIVNTCLNLKIKNLTHVSSTAAIGREKKLDVYTENSKWVNSPANSNYAVSKYLAEMEVWRGQEEGLNIVIVNPSVILGAGDWNESSLTLFKSIKNGLNFYTEGVNAFVDARDVAFCMVELTEKQVFGERFLIISENLKFKTLFDLIAEQLGVKKPSIKVKPWMTFIAWRLEAIKSFITRKPPQITKETSKSAMQENHYSNQKIVVELGFKFTPINESVENAVNYQHFKANK